MEKYLTQIKIILSVFGDVFDPLSFSEYIKITPTDFWNKGDKIPLRNGLMRKESAWEYSTNFVQTLYFDEVSEIIIDKFWEIIPEFYEYIQQKGLNVKFDVVIEIVDNQVPALTFNRRFIELVNQLKSEIDIDMYLFLNN